MDKMEDYRKLGPCSYGKDSEMPCMICSALCPGRLQELLRMGGEIEVDNGLITVSFPEPWTKISTGYPEYYKEVLIRGDKIEEPQEAWLSTGSDGTGMYWNVTGTGEMIEVGENDEWIYRV